MRIILLGNSGSGKTTLARRLVDGRPVPILSLDAIAWAEGTRRRPMWESLSALDRFVDEHEDWVMEGCYGDLVEAALPYADELRFLNPGVTVCLAHCRQRPWEPDKFASLEEQQQTLAHLLEWVQQYETRGDEFGLARHRALYESFAGAKREYTDPDDYLSTPARTR